MKLITPEELKKKLKDKQTFQLIDVREPYEHEDGAIDNLNIPMNDLMEQKKQDIQRYASHHLLSVWKESCRNHLHARKRI
jgi:rhodanese-related sulfurtransferase